MTAWWQVAVDVIAAVVGVALLTFFTYAAFDSIRSRRGFREASGVPPPEPDVLAYPYYVDEQAIRGLAADLRVELPLGREVTRSRRLSAMFRGVGAESGTTEAAQFAGEINLNRLADSILTAAPSDRLAVTVAMRPLTGETGGLEYAVDMLENELGDRPEATEIMELLERLKQLYETEQQTTISRRKDEELREVAASNRLIVMTGSFEKCGDAGRTLRLVEFEPYDPSALGGAASFAALGDVYLYRMAQARADVDQLEIGREANLDKGTTGFGVGVEVILAAEHAFTPAGGERIARGHPFYGRVVAHSPSFDEDTRTLMCSAYAVWGLARPSYPSA